MKKIIALMLALTMVLGLCACGQSGEEKETSATEGSVNQTEQQDATEATQATEETAAATEDDYVFVYQNIEIAMNAPAAELISALGEPKNYTEETSCAFDGLDKTYFYGSFYLQTYPMEDVDYIYCLWIVDDSVETPEGIYIGASQDQVEAAYGADAYNGSNAYVITGSNTRLTVILENGVVSSIQYDAVI